MSAWYKVTISGSSPDSLLAQAGFEPSVPRKIPGTSPCWFSFALRLTGNQAASWHAVLMVRIHSPPAVSQANSRNSICEDPLRFFARASAHWVNWQGRDSLSTVGISEVPEPLRSTINSRSLDSAAEAVYS